MENTPTPPYFCLQCFVACVLCGDRHFYKQQKRPLASSPVRLFPRAAPTTRRPACTRRPLGLLAPFTTVVGGQITTVGVELYAGEGEAEGDDTAV
jgi:hypothetical protein